MGESGFKTKAKETPEGSLSMRSEQRLRKAERLTKTHQFTLMYKEGLLIGAKRLSLLVRPNGLDINRIGISISKRKVPTTSQRNRIKRLAKEVYRRNKTHLIKGMDILIKPAKIEEGVTYKLLELEMLGLFKRAGALKLRQKKSPSKICEKPGKAGPGKAAPAKAAPAKAGEVFPKGAEYKNFDSHNKRPFQPSGA